MFDTQLGELVQFYAAQVKDLSELGLDRSLWQQPDHACFRVASLFRYEAVKADLSKNARLLTESMVNGRPIACFELEREIALTDKVAIRVIEVPAPREGRQEMEGWEHFEFVVDDDLNQLLAAYTRVPFKTEGLANDVNPEIVVPVSRGVAKFHRKSLSAVVELERELHRARYQDRLLIFDFDDTLADTKEAFQLTVRDSYQTLTERVLSPERANELNATTYDDLMVELGLDGKAEVAEMVSLFAKSWSRNLGLIRVPTGVRTLMSTLFHTQVPLIVWSARDQKTLDQCVDFLNLRPYFRQVIGFDAKLGGKPHPSETVRELVSGKKALLIGDSQADFQAAKNLGIGFKQALWLKHRTLDSTSHGVLEHPVSSLSEILSDLH